MLGPNYSTLEHVTALIKMLRQSLVTRDTRFTIKERIIFSLKKYFSGYFELICLNILYYRTYVADN